MESDEEIRRVPEFGFEPAGASTSGREAGSTAGPDRAQSAGQGGQRRRGRSPADKEHKRLKSRYGLVQSRSYECVHMDARGERRTKSEIGLVVGSRTFRVSLGSTQVEIWIDSFTSHSYTIDQCHEENSTFDPRCGLTFISIMGVGRIGVINGYRFFGRSTHMLLTARVDPSGSTTRDVALYDLGV
ncbi:hypothetical protein B296_00004711 [Ensete ventricosum]|uniref:Uncharacterized protein n=1 Tax=Ensete ventricosum TaxID=4639 RepID=A0A427A5A6_ENSVE|nr:hypothetical protein B296_00004711 [Ensete ventricosum]